MGRPKGVRNKTPRAVPRHQVQIRLSDAEHDTMQIAAQDHGMTFGSWARMVLRAASGLEPGRSS